MRASLLLIASTLVGCTADTFTGSDASADAASESVPPVCGTSFCSSAPTNVGCADFDNGLPAPSDWNEVVVHGSLTVGGSPPKTCQSMVSQISMQQDAGALAGAHITKLIPVIKATPHIVLDLDVYLPANDTKSFVAFFGISAGTDSAINFTHHGDTSWFLSNATFSINQNVDQPLVGAWNHMTLDISFDPSSSGKVKLTYQKSDTTETMVAFTGKTYVGSVTAASVIVSVGMESAGLTEADFTAYYDNVLVTSN